MNICNVTRTAGMGAYDKKSEEKEILKKNRKGNKKELPASEVIREPAVDLG